MENYKNYKLQKKVINELDTCAVSDSSSSFNVSSDNAAAVFCTASTLPVWILLNPSIIACLV